MLTYPQIDPVLLSLGPLKVHWYGMMYLFGFMLAYWLAFGRSKRSDSPVKPEQVEDLILYGAMGVVLGGRIGYVFFYGFDQFLHDPLWLFRVWDGGMSFHGGLLGVMVAMWLYALKIKNDFVSMMDFIAPMVPVGLGFGRIGNFINQELWGRSTDVSWAMIFPNDPFMLPRHPSQLYQAALEGVLLFIILFSFSRKSRPRYAVSGLFLFCYGVFRFVVEFFREPDTQIGYELFGWMTRGQELCLPMIASGLFLLWYAYRHVPESVPAKTAVVAEAIVVDEVVVEKKPVRSKPKTTPVKKTTSVKKENKTTKAAIKLKSKTAKEKEVKKKK